MSFKLNHKTLTPLRRLELLVMPNLTPKQADVFYKLQQRRAMNWSDTTSPETRALNALTKKGLVDRFGPEQNGHDVHWEIKG